ncbi:hypothetical protein MTR67_052063 [Solanum verrucosum]|uniref:Uncharacterized protein n=1 Tax=Solanum verrucosum TaxID=315347 RepID=A0AAF0V8L5_SOLVR|nr:hypothetical protein MTR67_052063 [Solanum verrucosum]
MLKVITTLGIKVYSMDNEIQKLKSKAISQSHDYKHAEICQSKDTKHPELERDVGILQKTHNDCFNAAAGTSKTVRKQVQQDRQRDKRQRQEDNNEQVATR